MVVRIIILCILSFLYVTHRIEDYIVLNNINKDNLTSDRLVDIFNRWGLYEICAWTVWKCMVVVFMGSLLGSLISIELSFLTMALEIVLVIGGILPSVLVLDSIGKRLIPKKGDR